MLDLLESETAVRREDLRQMMIRRIRLFEQDFDPAPVTRIPVEETEEIENVA